MKKIILFCLIFSSFTFAQEPTVITLSDVANHVKKQNYEVLQNAQRVYQARETINFSRRSLMPRLNLWSIATVVIDWRSAIGLVDEIAPFLVPNNWLRVKQSEILYLAKKEQYRALWANEIMNAKILYLNTLRDIDFLETYQEQYNDLKDLVAIVQARQISGEVPAQVLNFLKIRELQFSEDLRVLSNLVFEEKKALAYIMGLPQETSLELPPMQLPSIEELSPIEYDTFIFRAISSSPEVKQYKYIQSALKYLKKEVWFSFLGASSIARGINGGVFDNIPLQDGLGFGAGPSIRIARSESHILTIKENATKEVIKKNLYTLVNKYNSFIVNIDNQNERLNLAVKNYDLLQTQILIGQNVDPLEILESITNLLNVKLALLNYKYDAVASTERLTRIILNGDYVKVDPVLDEVLND